MNKNNILIILIITISYVVFASIPPKNLSYEKTKYFRGIRVGTSTFYDALRILGRPTTSISSNKNQVVFEDNMYFFYKEFGLKLYGKAPLKKRFKDIKNIKISKILIENQNE
jgi:hypothetical protein